MRSMKDKLIKDILDIIGILGVIILIFGLCYKINILSKEKEKYYTTTCILSDCCRNMIDNYGDPDSIYDNYINIAYEEIGVKEQEFTNYSYCY